MVLLMVAVTKADHRTHISNPVGPILEHVMRMGFPNSFAFGHSANPIPKRQIPFLPPRRMMLCCNQTSRRTILIAMQNIDLCIAKDCLEPRMINRWTILKIDTPRCSIPMNNQPSVCPLPRISKRSNLARIALRSKRILCTSVSDSGNSGES